MGLFVKKKIVSTEKFCREFYDQHIFAHDIGGVDPWNVFCNEVYKKITEVDPEFGEVELTIFTSELRTLRLEVVGLVWIHHVKDNFAPTQSEFTKNYLEEYSIDDVWEAMEDYNQAIARSTTAGYDMNSGMGRGKITFLNTMRADLFDAWIDAGYDNIAVARAANRYGSKTAWKSSRVRTYLTAALTGRLDCKVNDEARFRIMAVIYGFYEGVSKELKKVKIIP